jgi:hypothetical protein
MSHPELLKQKFDKMGVQYLFRTPAPAALKTFLCDCGVVRDCAPHHNHTKNTGETRSVEAT